ncbi:hypothetical protein Ptr902_06766 [Pyrenophora tritici-repentis]|nr:hypothetical protein Ptr902_06766 [Pyrenophora tritici-repentis]
MARIVQDSDEELDDDLERDLPPPKQPGAFKKPPSNNASLDTGSAESIRTATDAHLEPQLQLGHEEPQSSVSLPEHSSKKRKTAAGLSPCSPVTSSSKKKGRVIYGKTIKSIFSSSAVSDALPENQFGNYAAQANPPPSHGDTWNLGGTMRDEYAQHEPAMFAEPSSTVPNATMTQQRILEAVRGSVMLGEELEVGRPLYEPPPEPSVPWSDLMKFTPGEAAEQTESSDHEPPAPDVLSATPFRTTQKEFLSSPSQPGRDGSFGTRTSPLKNEVFHVQTVDAGRKTSSSHANLIAHENMSPTAPQGSLPATAPPASLPPTEPPTSQRSNKEGSKKSSRQSKTQVPIHGSDEDFMAIGLPVDQYKPRPSRSRSMKVDSEGPIDYSIRPEKARRRRTAAAAEVPTTVTITTPEKVRQICDMGFTPSTTTGALERNNGDVMQTIDWLVNNNIDHDELAPQSPPRSKSTSKKAVQLPTIDSYAMKDIMRNLDEYRRDEAEAEPTLTDNIAVRHEAPNNATTLSRTGLRPDISSITSPTKVQVIIPEKSPRPATIHPADATVISSMSKKAKRRKTTLDEPEEEQITPTSVVPEKVLEKKKRGRPKKAAVAVAPIEPSESIIEASEQDANGDNQDGILQTIEPNSASETAKPRSENALKEAELLAPTESDSPANSNPPSKLSPAAASATPEQLTKPATASPIPKGKVPYRVGLSKRARIAPLLRTLKK